MKRTKKSHNKRYSKLPGMLRMPQDQKDLASEQERLPADRGDLADAASAPDGGLNSGAAAAGADQEHTRFLAELGTCLWRLRESLARPRSGTPSEQMRWAYRHFESVWDVLMQAGVEVQDHTGALFDSGMALKVVAFQPTAGIERERVTETIRPSIYYKRGPIQMGEVIVATPEPPGEQTGNKETTGERFPSEDDERMAELFARQRDQARRD
jgi:hypothetical protein